MYLKPPCIISISFHYFFFQLFLQGESDLEGSTDEDDELKEINGGNLESCSFILSHNNDK